MLQSLLRVLGRNNYIFSRPNNFNASNKGHLKCLPYTAESWKHSEHVDFDLNVAGELGIIQRKPLTKSNTEAFPDKAGDSLSLSMYEAYKNQFFFNIFKLYETRTSA